MTTKQLPNTIVYFNFPMLHMLGSPMAFPKVRRKTGRNRRENYEDAELTLQPTPSMVDLCKLFGRFCIMCQLSLITSTLDSSILLTPTEEHNFPERSLGNIFK